MKILFITHYSRLLGANRSLLHLIRGLRDRRQVRPVVWCPGSGELTEALEREGIPFFTAPFANWAYSLRSPGLWLFPVRWLHNRFVTLPALRERAKEEAPDLIYSNSIAVSLGWQLSEALGIPHAWHLRELGSADWLLFPLGKRLLQKKLAQADRLIAISEAVRAAHPACAMTPTKVVYNGVGSLATFEARKQAAAQRSAMQGDFQFVNIGLIHPSKAQHEALGAFGRLQKSLRGIRLLIIGDGRRAYLRRLKRMAQSLLRPDEVHFAGYVARPDALMTASHALIFCGRNEGMGRVSAEGMSYALPVLGYRDGGTAELIRHGENGFLYDHEEALCAYMRQLVENPLLYDRLSENAWKFAAERFTDEKYVDEVYAHIRDARKKPQKA